MHDLDRTQNLFESEYQEMEYAFEGESDNEGESYEAEGDYEAALDEVEEMELAADLLEVQDEQELEEFLGKLIKKAKKAAGGFLKTAVGKQIGGLLKGAAKMALPAIGNAIAPGVGGIAAAKLGSVFGLELEGLSPQDQEFEEARQFVKLGVDAVANAANAPQNASPQQVAKAAVIQAAQKHAPGLIRPAGGYGGGARPGRRGRVRGGMQTGRWVRRGNRIMLIGV
jgi:hypothetical protein